MNTKINNAFVTLFIFGVFFLSLQCTVLSFSKDKNTFKKTALNSMSMAEEEDETEKTELEEEVVYVHSDLLAYNQLHITKIHWSDYDPRLFSSVKRIQTPPPRA